MRDETYVLGHRSLRQHRFPFLRGDTGRALPIDAFYPELKLAIEYRECQHFEAVPFFDRRLTVSRVSRREQRAIYDQRCRDVLPSHGIRLVEFNVTDFPHNRGKRLRRERERDLAVIRERLA
jgi:hypothetical protein